MLRLRVVHNAQTEILTIYTRLTVVNAIQLAMAVVANVVLLLNMTKKVKFTIAQPVTIVTWYISSICLVVLTATAAGPLVRNPESEYIWSGAFYYGIYAACLYFVCSSLMVVTFWGAMRGKYPKDFQLTTSQRTLMLQTIMFLIYLLAGALVFSTVEDWAYLDAVYWADVTLFTVGFGDFYPTTSLGRALIFPYALIGVISLGLVVGSIRSLVLERGRRQLAARMVEKKRKRMLRKLVKRGRDDILIPVSDDDGDGYESNGQTSTGLSEFERRQQEFSLMRKIQTQAEKRRRWMAMGVSTASWLMLWLVGAAVFQQCEVEYQGWTYFDGFYFAFVSLTTIGYGDITPISPAGKSFWVFWSLLALPTMTVLISNAGDTVVKMIREWTDWLGTVTILPGDRGFKKEIKVFLGALSLGKVFGDDSDVEDSPPGFLGAAERHDDDDDEGTDEGDDEVKIAQADGHQREKSTGGLDREIDEMTDKRSIVPNETGSVGGGTDDASDTVNGESPSEPGGEKPSTHSSTPPSTNARRASTTPLAPQSISFAEPAERPSSRKTGDPSSRGHRAGSTSSSKSGGGPRSRSRSRPAHNGGGGGGGDGYSQMTRMTRAVSIPRTGAQLPQAVPADRHDYVVVLVDEVSRVTQHLKSKPPRKYGFEEWAWFLKLIGEDEGSAETHMKPVPRQRRRWRGGEKAKEQDDTTTTTQGDASTGDGEGGEQAPERLQWSWVGSRSPLMGTQEEAEWILEKLEQRLAEELRAMRDEKAAGRARGGGGGSST